MSWLDKYQPASWRGVPFLVNSHDWTSGRRIASHEFALRDTPATEDMGRRQRRYTLKAYVIADIATREYFAARDALRAACEYKGVGTLVHPYLGSLRLRLDTIKMAETKDAGGMATFDLAFLESGTAPTPIAAANTASTLLAGIMSTLSLVAQVYGVAVAIADRPGILFGMASQALGSLVGGMLGLPPSITGQISQFTLQITANLLAGPSPATSALNVIPTTVNGVQSVAAPLVGDPIAIAITDAFTAAATAVVALQQPVVGVADPILGQAATATAQIADPTMGVADFASWGAALPPPAGLQVQTQQQVQQMIIDLVCSAAVLAVAQIYAGTTWQTANAAQAAKAQMVGLIEARLQAAAAIGSNALFQGWLGLLSMVVADLIGRAQNLPSLTAYATTSRLPAPVLAQLLYQDGSQGEVLAALNGTVHPGFMAMNGIALSQLPGQGAI